MPARRKTTNLSAHTATPNWRHVSVYLPPQLFEQIAENAKTAHRSLSAEIVVVIEDGLATRKSKLAKGG